jgi:hypothetical protein
MEFRTLLFNVARSSAVSAEDFEQALRAEFMPAIDTGQTRAGRILEATAYRAADGTYRLLVDVETMTGSAWALGRLREALDRLGEIGAVDDPDDMQRIVTATEMRLET